MMLDLGGGRIKFDAEKVGYIIVEHPLNYGYLIYDCTVLTLTTYHAKIDI